MGGSVRGRTTRFGEGRDLDEMGIAVLNREPRLFCPGFAMGRKGGGPRGGVTDQELGGRNQGPRASLLTFCPPSGFSRFRLSQS